MATEIFQNFEKCSTYHMYIQIMVLLGLEAILVPPLQALAPFRGISMNYPYPIHR